MRCVTAATVAGSRPRASAESKNMNAKYHQKKKQRERARQVEETLQRVIEHDKTDMDLLLDSVLPSLYARSKTGQTKFYEIREIK